MRLEEAAEILGVSIDTPVDILKQQYRRLALHWHPDKCSKANAKDKFQQISMAYTKLISSHSNGHKVDSDVDVDAPRSAEDSREMAAFMRMFMDLVGIFHEEQGLSVDVKMPPAGVSFGMMFGAQSSEEWSTDDENADDGEEEDEEEGDGDGYDDEYYDSEEDNEKSDKSHGGGSAQAIWEPQAKNYSHMNLKEEARRERSSASNMTADDIVEAKKKLKNAKKRSEKRRKQKEKRQREAAQKLEEDQQRQQLEAQRLCAEELAARRLEESRLIREEKTRQGMLLIDSIERGDLTTVRQLLENEVDPNTLSKKADLATILSANHARNLLPNLYVLHYCLSYKESFDKVPGLLSPCTPDSEKSAEELALASELASNKLAIATYLLESHSDCIDFTLADPQDMCILHVVSARGDVGLLQLLLNFKEAHPERRAELDLNHRCGKFGWTPLHYSVEFVQPALCRMLLGAGALPNACAEKDGLVGAHVLQYAEGKLQREAGSSTAAALQDMVKDLKEVSAALERVRLQKEADRIRKEEKAQQEKLRQLEKESKERELLERKQRQLKEKQEKDRLRELEEELRRNPKAVSAESVNPKASPPTPAQPTPSSTATSSKKKKKKEKEKDFKPQQNPIPANAQTPLTVTLASPAPAQSVAAVDLASRDDMLDHLLAMGFVEADVLTAIQMFGRNLDKAITWLCDRPAVTAGPVPAVAGSQNGPPGSAEKAHNEVNTKSAVSSAAAGASAGAQSESASSKLQKDRDREKDLKEELRRINRAWNAKAEDEKKKAEQERKAREAERQQELLLQQQQQKQQMLLQQQLLQENSFQGMNPGIHAHVGYPPNLRPAFAPQQMYGQPPESFHYYDQSGSGYPLRVQQPHGRSYGGPPIPTQNLSGTGASTHYSTPFSSGPNALSMSGPPGSIDVDHIRNTVGYGESGSLAPNFQSHSRMASNGPAAVGAASIGQVSQPSQSVHQLPFTSLSGYNPAMKEFSAGVASNGFPTLASTNSLPSRSSSSSHAAFGNSTQPLPPPPSSAEYSFSDQVSRGASQSASNWDLTSGDDARFTDTSLELSAGAKPFIPKSKIEFSKPMPFSSPQASLSQHAASATPTPLMSLPLPPGLMLPGNAASQLSNSPSPALPTSVGVAPSTNPGSSLWGSPAGMSAEIGLNMHMGLPGALGMSLSGAVLGSSTSESLNGARVTAGGSADLWAIPSNSSHTVGRGSHLSTGTPPSSSSTYPSSAFPSLGSGGLTGSSRGDGLGRESSFAPFMNSAATALPSVSALGSDALRMTDLLSDFSSAIPLPSLSGLSTQSSLPQSSNQSLLGLSGLSLSHSTNQHQQLQSKLLGPGALDSLGSDFPDSLNLHNYLKDLDVDSGVNFSLGVDPSLEMSPGISHFMSQFVTSPNTSDLRSAEYSSSANGKLDSELSVESLLNQGFDGVI